MHSPVNGTLSCARKATAGETSSGAIVSPLAAMKDESLSWTA
jgi:hypothetical protein